MRKLKLRIEELAVESFDVQKDASQRGTVPAHDYSNPYDCGALCGPTYYAATCPPECYD